MPLDNFYKITQAIINKYRQEVLEILKTGDLTPYTYCKAQHKDYGTYDANYDARHHIARGLQFTPELDGQEGVEELIRNLLKEEIKDRKTNSFQGIGSTVEILVQLLQAYGHDADQLLFEQVKEANFDCHCGFEAGRPKRERDVYKLRDIQECIEILNQLKEHEAMSELIDIWKEQQTQWNAQNLSTWRYMERDRGNTQGEIQALQMLTDLTIQNGSLRDKCSKLDALLEKRLEAGCTCKCPGKKSRSLSEIFIHTDMYPEEIAMRKARFTEHQIIAVLKSVEAGRTVKDVCREAGISEASYYNWKAKYGGMEASDIKKLKDLEEENRRLKQMFADLSLECRALKDVIEKKL